MLHPPLRCVEAPIQHRFQLPVMGVDALLHALQRGGEPGIELLVATLARPCDQVPESGKGYLWLTSVVRSQTCAHSAQEEVRIDVLAGGASSSFLDVIMRGSWVFAS